MNTWNVYDNAVKTLESFRCEMSLEQKWPVPLSDLLSDFINLIAFLSNEYSPSTVKSCISGLSFRMKISGLLDTTNSFIIKKMLLGMQRLHKRVDSRTITIDLLVHIFDALQYTCSSVYETALFSSCFSLAFFAFSRVGEFAVSHLSRGICYNIPIYQLIRKMV